MATVKIIHTAHLPSAVPSRQGLQDAIIIYSVDDGAPSTITIADEDATPEKVQAAIKAQIEQSRAINGSSFTV